MCRTGTSKGLRLLWSPDRGVLPAVWLALLAAVGNGVCGATHLSI
jgi:hypothetical protein